MLLSIHTTAPTTHNPDHDEGEGVEDGDGNPPDASLETLEREARVQKKFSYHQDSMKRYKKQLSRNTDVVERKISEELAEGQTC